MKSDRNPHKIKEKTELPLESHRNPHRKKVFSKRKKRRKSRPQIAEVSLRWLGGTPRVGAVGLQWV